MKTNPQNQTIILRSILNFLVKFVVILLVLFTAAIGLLYATQDRLIFPAPAIVEQPPVITDLTPVVIETPDGEKLAAFEHRAEASQATVLVFHGNGDAAMLQRTKARALVDAGMGVLLVEYRGYPGSTGNPTEAGLATDALASYDFVRSTTNGPIGLYAHSIGTGVAVKLATQRTVSAVVLESPFDSLLAIARLRFNWLPLDWLLKHPFRSDLHIADITAPILIMHGVLDRVIPIEHGRQLHALAPSGTEFIAIEDAGHNDLTRFGAHEKAVQFFKSTLKATQ